MGLPVAAGTYRRSVLFVNVYRLISYTVVDYGAYNPSLIDCTSSAADVSEDWVVDD